MGHQRQQYEALVHQHAADLYRLAYRLSGNRQLAEDLVQETFLEAWRNLQTLRRIEAGRAWLLQILRYRWCHMQRDASRRPPTTLLDDGAGLTIAPDDRVILQDWLQQSLDRLAPIYREPLLLAVMEGLRCEEIAGLLKIPLGTVLSRLSRARRLMAEYLAEQEAQSSPRVTPLRRRARPS